MKYVLEIAEMLNIDPQRYGSTEMLMGAIHMAIKDRKDKNEFLLAYASYLEWPETDPQEIMHRLCEEQIYNPRNRDFTLIAYGWFWHESDQIKATVKSGMLEMELNKVYEEVSKKNNWDEK